MIRCSSISQIMTKPRAAKAEWSETAKTAMLEAARERMFNVRKSLDEVKCIQKGIMCEDEGIKLYNDVFLYDLKKVEATERRSNGIITGEPDLIAMSSQKGVDIKVAWTLLTFPLTEDQAGKKAYEWQARGYMCLFDLPEWEIIPAHHRITVAKYTRDMDIEKEMLDKCAKANAWIDQAVASFVETHNEYLK